MPACLNCGHDLDMARPYTSQGLGEEQPQTESLGLSICSYCSHVMFFIDGSFRELTLREREEAFNDRRLVDLIFRIAGMNNEQRKQFRH